MDTFYFVKNELKNIQGWCKEDKAFKLINIIKDIKPNLCVEIGVFGGSSLLPQALALKENGIGIIVGIDPWTNEAALEDMEEELNKNWWGKQNMEFIYNRFISNIEKFDLKKQCVIRRNKSENVVNEFSDGSIDILHIDGNHCEKLAYQDAVMYLPKVKIGGYIFYDDSTWIESGNIPSTEKGLNFLLNYCDKIDIVGNDCVVLRKNK